MRRATITLAAVLCAAVALNASPPAQAARVLLTTEPRTDLRTGATRNHPRVTVLPPGIRIWAEDFVDGFYFVRLADGVTAWVELGHVQALDRTEPRPPVLEVDNLTVTGDEAGATISLPIDQPMAWRVQQQVDPPALALDLFRVRLGEYGLRYFPEDTTVWAVLTERKGEDWTRVVVYLNGVQHRGCRVTQTGGQFRLLVRAPYADPSIAGKVIVIDPGHGGSDSGAVGPTGLREKDVNLRIALQLAALLTARAAVPRLLRTTDSSVGPPGSAQRVELEARLAASEAQADADFFLSIHNNAVGSGNRDNGYGSESFWCTPMSALPAAILQQHLCARLHTKNRRLAWQPFYVLRHYDVPRVLVECAYVSNPTEEQRLRSDQFVVDAALALVEGLEEFFQRAVPPVPSPPVEAAPAQ